MTQLTEGSPLGAHHPLGLASKAREVASRVGIGDHERAGLALGLAAVPDPGTTAYGCRGQR
ncbi:MAG: hypothetical protein ABIQ13_09340 [Pedococcus sp.]